MRLNFSSNLRYKLLGRDITWKDKISKTRIEKELAKGSNNPNYNNHYSLSKETKEKMRLSHIGKVSWNKGVPMLEEVKLKISKSISGVNNHFYGKHHTIDTKNKISKSNKGKVISNEQKQIVSMKLKGKIVSEETILKLSIARKKYLERKKQCL
jgi:hypothetical protein